MKLNFRKSHDPNYHEIETQCDVRFIELEMDPHSRIDTDAMSFANIAIFTQ